MKIISCRYLVTFILLFNLIYLSHVFSDTKKFDSRSMEFSSASFNEFFELKEIVKLSQKKILIGSIRELKTDKYGNIWNLVVRSIINRL